MLHVKRNQRKPPSSARSIPKIPIKSKSITLNRPFTATRQITRDPFQKVKSELSLATENLVNGKNEQRDTPRTRYSLLNECASMHSLTDRNHTESNSLPKVVNAKKSDFQFSKNISVIPPIKAKLLQLQSNKFAINKLYKKQKKESLHRSLSSLGLHSQIQNDTTSVWFDLLSSRYSRKKEDIYTASDIHSISKNLNTISVSQQDAIDFNFRQIDRIINDSKDKSPNKKLLRGKSQPVLKSITNNKNLRRCQTVKQLRTNERKSHKPFQKNKDILRLALDKKIENLRDDDKKRSNFKRKVRKIKSERHKRCTNTNYMDANIKSAKDYSKDCHVKNAKKANEKWKKTSDKMRLFKQRKDELLQLKKEEFHQKLKHAQKRSKKKVKYQSTCKQSQQQKWMILIEGLKHIEATLSIQDRMEDVLKWTQRQKKCANVISKFYKMHMTEKENPKSTKIIKKLQNSVRRYSAKNKLEKEIDSSVQILSFLSQFNKVQGLAQSIDKLDLNGNATMIQNVWRSCHSINNCQKHLMTKQFIKHQEIVHDVSNADIPSEIMEAAINDLFWKKKNEWKANLKTWSEQYDAWKTRYDEQIKDAELKQQIGIKASVNYDPPLKPRMKVLLSDEEILELSKCINRT